MTVWFKCFEYLWTDINKSKRIVVSRFSEDTSTCPCPSISRKKPENNNLDLRNNGGTLLGL